VVAFADIRAAALQRHGQAAIEARLPTPRDPDELRQLPERFYLSQLSLRTFRAGLRHELVDRKWPAFEEVFEGFDPDRCAGLPDERIEELLADRRLIRNLPKLRAVRANAEEILRLRTEGGIAPWIASWPATDIVALWDEIARRFQQMGGTSGPWFLRMVGKDTFLLTGSVMKGLSFWEAFVGEPKSKADRRAVQQAFNAWSSESGLPMSHLSMILGMSLDT
jgi:3-methyladenine DNA glycosylase Tag